MEYIAVFDIGTTAIKGTLISRTGRMKAELSYEVTTLYGENGEVEQNPEEWWTGIQFIISKWLNLDMVKATEIKMITFSGQMEDVIPIHKEAVTSTAILYSDTRAGHEAERIYQNLPGISDIVGNTITASTPLAKLLWLKEHQSDLYQSTSQFVFSAKDYIINKLTGVAVTDPVTGATTGMMDIQTRDWDRSILDSFHIEVAKLPILYAPHEIAGVVTTDAANVTGLLENTPVLCGCGDAGAATMGARAVREGDSYLYLGTTGWIAIPSRNVSPKDNGIFTLAHLPEDINISIAPLLNAGNVHKWAIKTFLQEKGDQAYLEFEELVQQSSPGANGLLFLPYVNGERCPINDSKARGAFWGVNPETKQPDFLRSVLEGISFSLRQTLEIFIEEKEGSITVIGGGARSAAWCQCLADILGREVWVPNNSEFLPSFGVAATAFLQLGWVESYEQYVDQYLKGKNGVLFEPNENHRTLYDELYERFLKMYPGMMGVYN